MSIKILKVGTWLYDEYAENPVDIVGLLYDWWFILAEADNMRALGQEPLPFNEEGFLYYVRLMNAGEATELTWIDSMGYQDIISASEEAESKIKW